MKHLIRRLLIAVIALAAVLTVLLRHSADTRITDESITSVEATAAPDGSEQQVIEGELSWEYPEGWVDYSDLPAENTLGDEEMPGLVNWRYLMVNTLDQANFLKSTYFPDMELVSDEYPYYFQKRPMEALKAFIAAAQAEGFTVKISRTYLSYQDQKVRFNGMASTLYDQGGITLAEAEEQVRASGYFPGADEHQTALAVNFTAENGEAKFSTPLLKWMRENCAQYGFILRYPEGREEYTGQAAESGHFRYVGEVAAEYIMRKGITLEEFKDAYIEDEDEKIWDW